MATIIGKDLYGNVTYKIDDNETQTMLSNLAENGDVIPAYGGQPKIVTAAAEMTDTDVIYLYMGDEEGYTSGDWYYYDEADEDWKSGGAYVANPVTIDDTLTQAGEAADAKATGDAIDGVSADLTSAVAEIDTALDTKADTTGVYPYLTAGNAQQLEPETKVTDRTPYFFRPVPADATREEVEVVGGSVVWNQLVDSDSESVTVTSGHLYIASIGGTWSVATSDGTALSVTGGTDIVVDLTTMLPPSIVTYLAGLSSENAVAWVRKYFNLASVYSAPTIKSVEGVSAHVMRDADENIVGNYPIDSTLTLRGIPKIADGEMYFDGDEYKPDGTVTQKYKLVDLGELAWDHYTSSSDDFFRTATGQAKGAANSHSIAKALCTKYRVIDEYTGGDMTLWISGNGRINIQDPNYTDATTFKASLSGVMLVCERPTPTTESADPYTTPQICAPGGTEEWVSTGVVPVGQNTLYWPDLTAKVEGLPADFSTIIAPTETGTTASRGYDENRLFILDNVLYKVVSAIASGETITPGTNATAATLDDVIAELRALIAAIE